MAAALTIVYWRDIPAQVIAKAGRRSERRVLSTRFEKAIDQAAMHAGLHGSDAYLEHWRRSSPVACDDDLAAAADEAVARLEATFTPEVLAAHVRAGGREP